MEKIELEGYIKEVILDRQTKAYDTLAWYKSILSILVKNRTVEEAVSKLEGLAYYIPSRYTDGYVYKTPTGEIKQILSKTEPLISFQYPLTIDNSWFSNVKGKIDTVFGNVALNAVVIYPVAEDKIEFITGRVDTGKIEGILKKKIIKPSDKDTEDKITVKQFIDIVDRLYFLTNFAFLTNIAGTQKIITAPPGLKEKKKELLEKYKDQLSDPSKLVEFETELKKFDDEYIKDDPTYGRVIKGKTRDRRSKMFLSFGYERGFTTGAKVKPIIKSLEEGWSTDEEDFSSYNNALRSGSFSRGAETVLGGVAYKTLQKALSGIEIKDTDCKTQEGLKVLISKSDATKYVGREIMTSQGWTVVDNTDTLAKLTSDFSKEVTVRSPMYCKLKDGYCYHCFNNNLKNTPNYTSTLASELSSVILGMFMSLMHGYALTNTEIDVNDLVN